MSYTLEKWMFLLLCGLLTLGTGACGPSGKSRHEVRSQLDSMQESTLVGQDRDALDLFIVVRSMESAKGWGRDLKLSSSLQKRLVKYDGKVKCDANMKATSEPLLEEGAMTVIPEGAEISATISGALTANIRIVAGSVGVMNGEIVVGDETTVTVNGIRYRYLQQRWTTLAADEKP